MTSGLFLSLDGIDGCGKSTQARMLAQWLAGKGHDVVACRDPGSTDLGERLRELLLNSRSTPIGRRAEMLLYMASRAQLVDEVIRPALERGQTVVADRFLLANVVYQGYGGGLDVARLWEVGRVATDGITPQLTFVLDVDPQLALSRRTGTPDRLESEPDDFHCRVREGFVAEARKNLKTMRLIDASRTIDEVQAELRREVEAFLAG
jgi:dTMP kinase